MPSNATNGPGIAMVGIGSVLIYAGIKGYSALAVAQNLITGKPIATNVTIANPIVDKVDQTLGAAPTSTGTDHPSTSITKGSNRSIGKQLAAGYGWTGDEWTALETLWSHESSWNNHADNPSSHAYGIPQALPYSKMPQDAWPESAGGKSDASAQISWGLSYIAERYGSPKMAWAFWQANNWY